VPNTDLSIYEKLLRTIRDRKSVFEQSIAYGSIPDFTAFREQRAKLSELAFLEQELKDLLNKVVEND
jgi:hypothetical protein